MIPPSKPGLPRSRVVVANGLGARWAGLTESRDHGIGRVTFGESRASPCRTASTRRDLNERDRI